MGSSLVLDWTEGRRTWPCADIRLSDAAQNGLATIRRRPRRWQANQSEVSTQHHVAGTEERNDNADAWTRSLTLKAR
jgi:hypothetical protein